MGAVEFLTDRDEPATVVGGVRFFERDLATVVVRHDPGGKPFMVVIEDLRSRIIGDHLGACHRKVLRLTAVARGPLEFGSAAVLRFPGAGIVWNIHQFHAAVFVRADGEFAGGSADRNVLAISGRCLFHPDTAGDIEAHKHGNADKNGTCNQQTGKNTAPFRSGSVHSDLQRTSTKLNLTSFGNKMRAWLKSQS